MASMNPTPQTPQSIAVECLKAEVEKKQKELDLLKEKMKTLNADISALKGALSVLDSGMEATAPSVAAPVHVPTPKAAPPAQQSYKSAIPPSPFKTFSEIITKVQEDIAVTSSMLAKRLGVSACTIYSWQRSISLPPRTQWEHLAWELQAVSSNGIHAKQIIETLNNESNKKKGVNSNGKI